MNDTHLHCKCTWEPYEEEGLFALEHGCKCHDEFDNVECKEKYATTNDGETKFKIGSDQDKYLHANNLPHSHVCVKPNGEKLIYRWCIPSGKPCD